MMDGKVTVKVRRALLEYFLSENALPGSKTAEPGEGAKMRKGNGQVAIQNLDEVQRERLASDSLSSNSWALNTLRGPCVKDSLFLSLTCMLSNRAGSA